jgi:CDP-diacylglycerol--glycerol-3-phosphate 3-phosphatidyltransferase
MAALLVAPFVEPDRALLLLEGMCAFIAVGAGATALGRLVVIHQLLRRGANASVASEPAPGAPPSGTP